MLLRGDAVVMLWLWCDCFTPGDGEEDSLLSEDPAGPSMDLSKWRAQSGCSWGGSRSVQTLFVRFIRDMLLVLNNQQSQARLSYQIGMMQFSVTLNVSPET